ncbi:MAG: hypothetical protein JSR76_07875 [Verrucomicrobia bacterium]|nr:hypothetical protein [Verrucomicrobiota bacterium]
MVLFGINTVVEARDVIEQEAQERVQLVTSLNEYLQLHVGEYEHPTYGTIQVTLDGNLLKASCGDTIYTIEYKDNGGFLVCSNDQGVDLFFRAEYSKEFSKLEIALEPGRPRAVFMKVPKELLEESYLRQFVGRYEDGNIILKEGRLICGHDGTELVPVEPYLFGFRNWWGTIAFLTDDNGEISELQFSGSGVRRTYKIVTSHNEYLERHVGEYEHPTYGTIQVTLDGNLLKASYGETIYTIEYKDNGGSLVCSNDQGVDLFFRAEYSKEFSKLEIALEPGQPRTVFVKVHKELLEESYLRQFVGRYEELLKESYLWQSVGEHEDVNIILKEGRLICANDDTELVPYTELVPVEPYLFGFRSWWGTIAFLTDENGEISELQFSGSGVRRIYKKVKE